MRMEVSQSDGGTGRNTILNPYALTGALTLLADGRQHQSYTNISAAVSEGLKGVIDIAVLGTSLFIYRIYLQYSGGVP